MAKMNWDRVRGEGVVRDRGAETIETKDRTIIPTGDLAQRPEPVPGKRGSAIGRKANGNIIAQPYIRQILQQIRPKKAAATVSKVEVALGRAGRPKSPKTPPNRKWETIDAAREAVISAEREKAQRKADREADDAKRSQRHLENEHRWNLTWADRHRHSRSTGDASATGDRSAPRANVAAGTAVQHIGKHKLAATIGAPAPAGGL